MFVLTLMIEMKVLEKELKEFNAAIDYQSEKYDELINDYNDVMGELHSIKAKGKKLKKKKHKPKFATKKKFRQWQ